MLFLHPWAWIFFLGTIEVLLLSLLFCNHLDVSEHVDAQYEPKLLSFVLGGQFYLVLDVDFYASDWYCRYHYINNNAVLSLCVKPQSWLWLFVLTDAELIVNDSEHLARPEEERVTQAEKNKHMQEQLKVGVKSVTFTYTALSLWLIKCKSLDCTNCFISYSFHKYISTAVNATISIVFLWSTTAH